MTIPIDPRSLRPLVMFQNVHALGRVPIVLQVA